MKLRTINLGTLDSTNRHARAEIESGRLRADEPAAFVADRQSGGVGRFARAWSSPAGGLWYTLAWPAHRNALDGLGLRIGVACVEFVRGLLPENARSKVRLKWPNDVVVDGKKVLGVLCEAVRGTSPSSGWERMGRLTGGGSEQPPPATDLCRFAAAEGARAADANPLWILIGVGLNTNFDVVELPSDLHATATTLRSALGVTIDLSAAADDLGARLTRVLSESGLAPEHLSAARAMLDGIGKPARVSLPTGEKIDATLIGLDSDGHAVFEQDGSRWAAPGSVEITE